MTNEEKVRRIKEVKSFPGRMKRLSVNDASCYRTPGPVSPFTLYSKTHKTESLCYCTDIKSIQLFLHLMQKAFVLIVLSSDK